MKVESITMLLGSQNLKAANTASAILAKKSAPICAVKAVILQ